MEIPYAGLNHELILTGLAKSDSNVSAYTHIQSCHSHTASHSAHQHTDGSVIILCWPFSLCLSLFLKPSVIRYDRFSCLVLFLFNVIQIPTDTYLLFFSFLCYVCFKGFFFILCCLYFARACKCIIFEFGLWSRSGCFSQFSGILQTYNSVENMTSR